MSTTISPVTRPPFRLRCAVRGIPVCYILCNRKFVLLIPLHRIHPSPHPPHWQPLVPCICGSVSVLFFNLSPHPHQLQPARLPGTPSPPTPTLAAASAEAIGRTRLSAQGPRLRQGAPSGSGHVAVSFNSQIFNSIIFSDITKLLKFIQINQYFYLEFWHLVWYLQKLSLLSTLFNFLLLFCSVLYGFEIFFQKTCDLCCWIIWYRDISCCHILKY